MADETTDSRRATAQRNIEAILDAAEAQLARRGAASISAVAAEAGVSRVTVYAHFATRTELLEAVVERAVARATLALEAAEPERGPADEALRRVIAAAWHELDHNAAIAQASAEQLSPAALERTHAAAQHAVGALIERGRADGVFRTDLSTAWLLTACFALIHAAGDSVRGGRMKSAAALAALTTTIGDLLAAR